MQLFRKLRFIVNKSNCFYGENINCSWSPFNKKCNVYCKMFNAFPSSQLRHLRYHKQKRFWIAIKLSICLLLLYIFLLHLISFTTLSAFLSPLKPQSSVNVLYDLGSGFWDRASCCTQAVSELEVILPQPPQWCTPPYPLSCLVLS